MLIYGLCAGAFLLGWLLRGRFDTQRIVREVIEARQREVAELERRWRL